MGFSYTISLMLYFSDVHKKFGYHNNDEFKTNSPELPEKYHSCLNGIYGNLDYEFFKSCIEYNNDENIMFISSSIIEFDLLPNIDTFIEENSANIDNVNEFKEHYQNLKELIEYLIDSEMTWYLSFSY